MEGLSPVLRNETVPHISKDCPSVRQESLSFSELIGLSLKQSPVCEPRVRKPGIFYIEQQKGMLPLVV